MVEDANKNNDKLLIEVYKDAISPAAKEVGKMVSLPFQAINAALSGAKIWVAEKQYNYDRTLKLLAQKMEGVSVENISPPDNYIAVPALQQISYCYDSEELRNMYANLLASSMQNDKKWEIHPSFVDIIKQLSPDDARILEYMYKNEETETAAIRLIAEGQDGNLIDIINNFSLVSYKAQCENPLNVPMYINNLHRLGLIVNEIGIRQLFEDEKYEEIISSEFVKRTFEQIKLRKDGFSIPNFEKGYIAITSFGQSFCKVCIN